MKLDVTAEELATLQALVAMHLADARNVELADREVNARKMNSRATERVRHLQALADKLKGAR